MDTYLKRLKKTLFIVEANSFEVLTLWQQHASESPHRLSFVGFPVFEWEQLNPGTIFTCGKMDDGRPVNISVQWVKLDNHLIMFWEACSQIVDFQMVEAWLETKSAGAYRVLMLVVLLNGD